jgi:hypothetical protein
MHEIFLAYILPVLICGAFFGSILYLFLAQYIHDYLQKNFRDALPAPLNNQYGGGTDFSYLFEVWHAWRVGTLQRMESCFWRGFFRVTVTVGGVALLSMFVLFGCFLFKIYLLK